MDKETTTAYMVVCSSGAIVVSNYLEERYLFVDSIKPRRAMADRDIALIGLWMRARKCHC